jgi:CRP/FNR family transcriptional regulator, cyclic AMP receptor protein
MASSRPQCPANMHPHQDMLDQDQWFSSLPMAVRQLLLQKAQLRSLQDGNALFFRGDAFDGIYCLVSGMIRISCETEAGVSGILALIEKGQWFGEVGLFDRKNRPQDAVAEGATEVLQLSTDIIDAILLEDPSLWRHFGVLIASKMRSMFIGLEAYALLPGQVWVARRLLLLAQQGHRSPASQRGHIVPVSQEQMAQMLGQARQTTSKMLRKLEADGVLRCGYRHIEIVDWDGLCQAAQLHRR